MAAKDNLVFNFALFVIVVICTNGFSDDEFCHPHCLVTCLPSCQCCDSNEQITDEEIIDSKRSQLKLEKLEQILRDKDLEVGIVCRSSCKTKCLPSCKFECCRDQKYTKKMHHMKKPKASPIQTGFDLRKLLKSMEETQKEYKKLKEFIKKVNGSVSGLSDVSKSFSNSGFHIVTKQKPKVPKNNLVSSESVETPFKSSKKVKNTGGEEKSLKKQENIELLQQLYDIQEKLDQKEKLKEKVERQLLDSPYTKLLTTKQKIKVELVDGPEITLPPLKKRKHTIRKFSNKTDDNSNEVSKTKEIRNYYHISSKTKQCEPACKEFCSESCNFECCLTKDKIYSNSSQPIDEKVDASPTNSNGSSSLVDNPVGFEYDVSTQLNSTLLGLQNLTNLSSNTKQLLETKHQLDSLLGILEQAKEMNSRNATITGDSCHPACKKDCTPDCPFECC